MLFGGETLDFSSVLMKIYFAMSKNSNNFIVSKMRHSTASLINHSNMMRAYVKHKLFILIKLSHL